MSASKLLSKKLFVVCLCPWNLALGRVDQTTFYYGDFDHICSESLSGSWAGPITQHWKSGAVSNDLLKPTPDWKALSAAISPTLVCNVVTVSVSTVKNNPNIEHTLWSHHGLSVKLDLTGLQALSFHVWRTDLSGCFVKWPQWCNHL